MTQDALKEVLAESEEGKLGLEELEFVLTNSKSSTQSFKIEFDFTLARQLLRHPSSRLLRKEWPWAV